MRSIPIADSSAVAHARREVAALATARGFDADDVGRAALVTTEMCGNLLKHAGGGELLVQSIDSQPSGIELLALDKGPGMADVAVCLRDGYSTGGSPGTGLGAIERLSQSFDIYSQPGRGTVVFARLSPRQSARPRVTADALGRGRGGRAEAGRNRMR